MGNQFSGQTKIVINLIDFFVEPTQNNSYNQEIS